MWVSSKFSQRQRPQSQRRSLFFAPPSIHPHYTCVFCPSLHPYNTCVFRPSLPSSCLLHHPPLIIPGGFSPPTQPENICRFASPPLILKITRFVPLPPLMPVLCPSLPSYLFFAPSSPHPENTCFFVRVFSFCSVLLPLPPFILKIPVFFAPPSPHPKNTCIFAPPSPPPQNTCICCLSVTITLYNEQSCNVFQFSIY